MRQILSTALVAVIVSLLTLTVAGAMAQSPAQEAIAPAAGLDADRVDGKHAINATAKVGRRVGKLVAMNKWGYLPSNTIRPLWGLIKGVPAGFADGVDDAGVTSIHITTVESAASTVTPGSWDYAMATCPGGKVVGGGPLVGGVAGYAMRITDSYPAGPDSWVVFGVNDHGTESATLKAYAVCMTTTPGAVIATAKSEYGPAGERPKRGK